MTVLSKQKLTVDTTADSSTQAALHSMCGLCSLRRDTFHRGFQREAPEPCCCTFTLSLTHTHTRTHIHTHTHIHRQHTRTHTHTHIHTHAHTHTHTPCLSLLPYLMTDTSEPFEIGRAHVCTPVTL